MTKKILRTKSNDWCEIEIKLADGRLSVSGSAGYILTRKQAEQEALRYWESYFEESPETIKEMNERCNTNFRSPKSAARYVIQMDGEFHGLDVNHESDDKIYVVSCCGQIREEMLEYFPDFAHLFPWHLNDMRAGTPEQEEALKEGRPANGYWDYDAQCAYLDSLGLLTVEHDGAPYTYGTKWLKQELPPEIVAFVQTL